MFADEDLTVDYDYFHDPAGVGLDDGGGSYADLDGADLGQRDARVGPSDLRRV